MKDLFITFPKLLLLLLNWFLQNIL